MRGINPAWEFLTRFFTGVGRTVSEDLTDDLVESSFARILVYKFTYVASEGTTPCTDPSAAHNVANSGRPDITTDVTDNTVYRFTAAASRRSCANLPALSFGRW